MGTIPTITTFTAGAILTAPEMNSIKAANDFWALTPRCSVYQSSVTSISNSAATWTVVAFQAEVFDVVQLGVRLVAGSAHGGPPAVDVRADRSRRPRARASRKKR